MRRLVHILLVILLSYQGYSQTTEYTYSCGDKKSTITWIENRLDSIIYLKTIQGSETHKYVMNQNFNTLSWEYSDTSENIDIKAVLENGIYKIEGTFKSKAYSETYDSKGYPWYQNIGFNVGYSIERTSSFKFECIRPDNLKLYEMQADAKEISNANGNRQQRINISLTGMLSKFFGSDYYIDLSTRKFILYKGRHGAPGTPITTITIKK